MVDIVFRGAGPWGPGSPGDLTEVQFDTNNWNLKQGVEEALANHTTPNNIANITQPDSTHMLITMDDATTYLMVLPIAEFYDRGEYAEGVEYHYADILTSGVMLVMSLQDHTSSGPFNPLESNGFGPLWRVLFDASGMSLRFLDDGYPAEGETLYAFEVFSIPDDGVYMVLQNHAAVDPFDPALLILGLPAYQKIFSAIETIVARIQFQYAGTVPSDSSLVWKLIQDDARDLVLAPDFSGSAAHIEVAVTTNIEFEFMHGDISIGTLSFTVGDLLDGDGGQYGTFLGDGATIAQGELLRMIAPSVNGGATYLTVALVGGYAA